MKKLFHIYCLAIALSLAIKVNAQNINRVEWFIDNNPAFGSGVPVSITPAADISNLSIPLTLAALAKGFHNVFVRSRDDNGMWSLTNRWTFFKDAVANNVTKLEYFIDTDPGFGNATNIPITSGPDVPNVVIPVDLSSLSNGFHKLSVRSQDNNGIWSLTNIQVFVKDMSVAATNIDRIEYFVDTDPGFGSANTVSFSSGSNVADVVIPINTGGLTTGFHNLMVRSRDNNGSWSLTNRWLFFKDKAVVTTIDKVEYYVDTDPGFGNANNVSITPGSSVNDVVIPINTTSLSKGFHRILVRSHDNNGSWSLTNQFLFFRDNVNATTITRGEYFFNTDPGFGNGTSIPFTQSGNIADYTFSADVSTYPNGPNYLFVRTLDNNGSWSLTNVIQFQRNVVLPVSLLSFTAIASNHTSILEWKTASEQNTLRFDVERSADGVSFSKIGEVGAAGYSSSQRSYRYVDGNISASTYYYKLRQIDKDGKETYTPTRKVDFDSKSFFTLLNNPSNGNPVIIKTSKTGSLISVFDASGKKVLEQKITNSTTSIAVEKLVSGTYLVVLNNNGKVEGTAQFVVQR